MKRSVILLILVTFSMLYPSLVVATPKSSFLTQDDDGFNGYRIVLASGDTQDSKSSIYTHDENGNLAQRMVLGAGSSSGGGVEPEDDVIANSLDVLLYVKSSTIEPHDPNESVIIRRVSGSDASKAILAIKDDVDTYFDFDYVYNSPTDIDAVFRLYDAAGVAHPIYFDDSAGRISIDDAFDCNQIYLTKINNNTAGGDVDLIFEVTGHNANQFEFWKAGIQTAYIESGGIAHFLSYKPFSSTSDLILELGNVANSFLFQDPAHGTLASIDGTGNMAALSYTYTGPASPADQDVALVIPNTHSGNALVVKYGSTTIARVASNGNTDLNSLDLPHCDISNKGIISKDSVPFLHDFSHPTGSTAIPEGYNIFLGEDCGNFTMGSTATNTDDGSENIMIGNDNGVLASISRNNLAIGQRNLNIGTNLGRHNYAIGDTNLSNPNGGTNNIAVGSNCGPSLTGDYNLLFGSSCGKSLTGDCNFFAGLNVGYSGTSCYNNIGIGNEAMRYLRLGDNNVALGEDAGWAMLDGHDNVLLGTKAGYSTNNGYDNNFFGGAAGYLNTTGYNNFAAGVQALRNNTTGHGNVALGYQALHYKGNGNQTTAVGPNAGQLTTVGTLSDAEQCLYLGYMTKALENGAIEEIVVGPNAIGHGSHTATVGSANTTSTYTMGRLHVEEGLVDESILLAIQTVSGALSIEDSFIRLDSSASVDDLDLALVTAVGNAGKIYNFKVVGVMNGTIAITTNGTETIDGGTELTQLTAQWDAIGIISDGTNWLILP